MNLVLYLIKQKDITIWPTYGDLFLLKDISPTPNYLLKPIKNMFLNVVKRNNEWEIIFIVNNINNTKPPKPFMKLIPNTISNQPQYTFNLSNKKKSNKEQPKTYTSQQPYNALIIPLIILNQLHPKLKMLLLLQYGHTIYKAN